MTKPLWSDLSDSMARMQGRQMLPLGEYDDALGWVLTMATYRRAAWRAGDSITTPQIAAYFLQFRQVANPAGLWERLRALARRYHFAGAYDMIEWIAGGKPIED